MGREQSTGHSQRAEADIPELSAVVSCVNYCVPKYWPLAGVAPQPSHSDRKDPTMIKRKNHLLVTISFAIATATLVAPQHRS